MGDLHTFLLTRMAALTALVVIGLLASLLVTAPAMLATSSGHSAVVDALTELSAHRGEAASLPRIKAQLTQARLQLKSFEGLIQAANTSLAQAQIQSDVKAMIEDNLGTLRSAQPQTEIGSDGLDEVAVQFDAVIPMSRVRDLLYAIETHRPYLLVTDLQIVGPQTWDPAHRDPPLEIRWTTQGFRSLGIQ